MLFAVRTLALPAKNRCRRPCSRVSTALPKRCLGHNTDRALLDFGRHRPHPTSYRSPDPKQTQTTRHSRKPAWYPASRCAPSLRMLRSRSRRCPASHADQLGTYTDCPAYRTRGNARCWRIPFVPGPVDVTSSASRRRTAGICAFRPAAIDVNRPLRIAAVDVKCATCCCSG